MGGASGAGSFEQQAVAGLPPRRPGQKRKEVLILACPRSGTRWMAEVLRQTGLAIRHEGMGGAGTIGPQYAVDDYWYGAKYKGDVRSNYCFARTLHQVRHPLPTIASLAADLPEAFWHWQEKHTGIGWQPDPILRAARFWCAWTRLIRRNPITYTYRIENIERVWPELCGILQLPGKRPLPEVSQATAHRRMPRRLAWEEIKDQDRQLYADLRTMAGRLGYRE